MPKFVIERDIEGLGATPADEMKAIAQRSAGVLRDLGPDVQWIESYVTADKMYCVYHAADEALVREHARLGGFPADRVSEVASVISPVTAE
ncbi:DUF4242 domain-containing protein [Streptosporangiaceae bacterium NEAU-GS5]|nr:DUF4242 domain-containing protein [Streptosporangiaceae bacterium NEAU-GS5]